MGLKNETRHGLGLVREVPFHKARVWLHALINILQFQCGICVPQTAFRECASYLLGKLAEHSAS